MVASKDQRRSGVAHTRASVATVGLRACAWAPALVSRTAGGTDWRGGRAECRGQPAAGPRRAPPRRRTQRAGAPTPSPPSMRTRRRRRAPPPAGRAAQPSGGAAARPPRRAAGHFPRRRGRGAARLGPAGRPSRPPLARRCADAGGSGERVDGGRGRPTRVPLPLPARQPRRRPRATAAAVAALPSAGGRRSFRLHRSWPAPKVSVANLSDPPGAGTGGGARPRARHTMHWRPPRASARAAAAATRRPPTRGGGAAVGVAETRRRTGSARIPPRMPMRCAHPRRSGAGRGVDAFFWGAAGGLHQRVAVVPPVCCGPRGGSATVCFSGRGGVGGRALGGWGVWTRAVALRGRKAHWQLPPRSHKDDARVSRTCSPPCPCAAPRPRPPNTTQRAGTRSARAPPFNPVPHARRQWTPSRRPWNPRWPTPTCGPSAKRSTSPASPSRTTPSSTAAPFACRPRAPLRWASSSSRPPPPGL